MTSGNSRRPGWQSRNGGEDYDKGGSTNVVRNSTVSNLSVDFDRLTARLILNQFRAGKLPEAVLVALMAGVGLVQ